MSSEPKKKPVTRLRARTTDTPRALDFDTLLVENARKIVGFREYIKEMWHRRGLVRVLAGRQLKSQYELNVVGFTWWLAERVERARTAAGRISFATEAAALLRLVAGDPGH